ncbi:MAG: hypothetical protein MH321_14860 [Leptospiraceae bacterium]|nr:hypothetical protein [Leptospiraceae bacterium]
MNRFKFSRRSFLSGSLVASGFLLAPDIFKSLKASSMEEIEFAKRDPLKFAERNGIVNPIHKIILTGIVAPNSHNSQPWKIKILSDKQFELYADGNRQLLPIDPVNRQLYHTQGTFIEFASIASEQLGYDLKVQLFPQGIDKAQTIGTLPIAKFTLSDKRLNKLNSSGFYEAINNRQMNRGQYSGDYLGEELGQEILSLVKPNFASLVFVFGQNRIQEIIPMFQKSFEREISNPIQNNVSREWFRISKEDIYTKRDGITLEGNGLKQPILWMAKTFFMDMSEEGWNSEDSVKQANESFAKSLETSKGFVFLVSRGLDDAKSWVQAGREFGRLTLACAKLGIAFHTMNQAFVDTKESNETHDQFKKSLNLPKDARIQLAGRMGYAEPSFVSPRRELKEFIL